MSDIGTIIRFLAAILLLMASHSRGLDSQALAGQPTPRRIIVGKTLQPEDENQFADVDGLVTFVGKQGRATYLEISSEAGHMPVSVLQGTGYSHDIKVRGPLSVL